MQRLVTAIVLSRLDYCNAILAGLPASSLAPLTRVLHAAARLVAGLRLHDSVTPTLRALHWLPIEERIRYKICLMMFSVVHSTTPVYISGIVIPTSSVVYGQHLRAASAGDYIIPRLRTVRGRRAFCFAGPHEWNRLPSTLRASPSVDTFKKNLKTYLFTYAYK